MKTIKPIETRYAGCRFRSRTEARWAVFFDHLGIKWEYEKEGYDLSSELDCFDNIPEEWDGAYLPDFYLPEWCTWIEVKGALPSNHFAMTIEEVKAWCLSKHTGMRTVVYFGMPGDDTPCSKAITSDPRPRMERETEYGLAFFVLNMDPGKALPGPTMCPVRNAVIAALSARFEFGEKGGKQ